MDDYESLSHSKWECKYHGVFIPKCRRKTLYGELRRHQLGTPPASRIGCCACAPCGDMSLFG